MTETVKYALLAVILAVGILFASILTGLPPDHTVDNGQVATSTLSIVPPASVSSTPESTLMLDTINLFDEVDQEPSTNVDSPAPPSPPPPAPTPPAPPPTPPVTLPLPPPSLPPYGSNLTLVNEEARAATVNILCSHTIQGGKYYDSGTGVVIDPRGVILTNAHIAQHFLLDENAGPQRRGCVIRVGSPARNRYTAELLYLPPRWIERFGQSIAQEEFSDAGEEDYAFLLISGRTDPEALLPESFSYIPVSSDNTNFDVGTGVLVAAYPGEFLSIQTLLTDFYLSSAIASVQKFFGFTGTTPDAVSLGGIIVAQKGSSGSGVFSEGPLLHAIIEGTVLAETTDERNAFAITTSHINRSLINLTGDGIHTLLSGDLLAKATTYQTTHGSTLRNILLSYLNK